MIDLQIQHHFSAGVYAKKMCLPVGHTATSHSHRHDHLSILAIGTAVVTVNGERKIYHAGSCIEIKAGLVHEITALEDVTWFCIHATDETDVAKIDETLIKEN